MTMTTEPVAAKTPGIGHNSAPDLAVDRLRNIVERIEHLAEEKKAIMSDTRDIYLEAKSSGFDVKVLRKLIRLRQQDIDVVEEEQDLLDTYMHALGA